MSSDNGSPGALERGGGFTLQMVVFILVRTLLNTAVRMVYPYLGVFQRGLGVDLRLFSLGISMRSASGIFGPFLAVVGDRYGRRSGMLLGVGMFTLGLSLVVISPTFPAFLAMMVLTNLGNLVFLPSMQAFIGDRVPYERRGSVLAYTEFSWSFSFIFGIPLVGLVIRLFGWQAPFPFLALLGILALAALYCLMPRKSTDETQGSHLRHNLRMVFTNSRALAGLGDGDDLQRGQRDDYCDFRGMVGRSLPGADRSPGRSCIYPRSLGARWRRPGERIGRPAG